MKTFASARCNPKALQRVAAHAMLITVVAGCCGTATADPDVPNAVCTDCCVNYPTNGAKGATDLGCKAGTHAVNSPKIYKAFESNVVYNDNYRHILQGGMLVTEKDDGTATFSPEFTFSDCGAAAVARGYPRISNKFKDSCSHVPTDNKKGGYDGRTNLNPGNLKRYRLLWITDAALTGDNPTFQSFRKTETSSSRCMCPSGNSLIHLGDGGVTSITDLQPPPTNDVIVTQEYVFTCCEANSKCDEIDCAAVGGTPKSIEELRDVTCATENTAYVTFWEDPHTNEKCTTVQQCCNNVLTCEDPDGDGTVNAFQCTEADKVEKPGAGLVGCAAVGCTVDECCNSVTCEDPDGDGTVNAFQCTEADKVEKPGAGLVGCAAVGCTVDECCNSVTCEDPDGDGTSNPYPCTGFLQIPIEEPQSVNCSAVHCTFAECCIQLTSSTTTSSITSSSTTSSTTSSSTSTTTSTSSSITSLTSTSFTSTSATVSTVTASTLTTTLTKTTTVTTATVTTTTIASGGGSSSSSATGPAVGAGVAVFLLVVVALILVHRTKSNSKENVQVRRTRAAARAAAAVDDSQSDFNNTNVSEAQVPGGPKSIVITNPAYDTESASPRSSMPIETYYETIGPGDGEARDEFTGVSAALTPRAPSAEKPFSGFEPEILTASQGFYLAPLDLNQYNALPTNAVGIDAIPREVAIRLKEFNRYKNILPNPETRVILKAIGSDPTSTFINANFISSFDGFSKGYIAAQGPKSTTIEHFWRMIWQENVRTIVMVTGLIEGTKEKCARYWPKNLLSSGGSTEYGGLRVGVLSGSRRQGYKIADLQVEGPGGETRKIKHFWFDSWPDYGVPVDTKEVPKMLAEARRWSQVRGQPWVVHCSAGIGRTGTFIGIDLGMNILETSSTVSVIDLVTRMRDGRGGMVQTAEQCEFIQDCLEDYAVERNRELHSKVVGADSSASIYGNIEQVSPPLLTQNLYGNIGPAVEQELDL